MSVYHDFEMILSSTPDVVSSGRVAVSDTETSSLSGFFANNGTSALKRKYQEWTKDVSHCRSRCLLRCIKCVSQSFCALAILILSLMKSWRVP